MNNKPISYNFSKIIASFRIEEDAFEVTPFGSGHINDTYLVKSKIGMHQGYLLQKINNFVFKDVDGLMANMLTVITHLKKKVANAGGDPEKEVLTLIPTKDGNNYFKYGDDSYWRMTCFLSDTRSYDLVTTTNQAYQGGVAFGRFQYRLSDLDPAALVEIIPDFLNIEKRLNDLDHAVEKDSAGRLKSALQEVAFLRSRAAAMNGILNLAKAGELPLRVTHNDTKFNNILLDKNNNIQCVIDLDTVMPGYIAYDFGDGIRSIINTAVEDEKNLDMIQLNIPLFTEFTKGYLSQTKSFLTETELRSLIMSVLLLPYMQAVRFLTDYLEGDLYYKTHFPEHNLQRTQAQMQLFKRLESNEKQLNDIVTENWLLVNTSLPAEKPLL